MVYLYKKGGAGGRRRPLKRPLMGLLFVFVALFNHVFSFLSPKTGGKDNGMTSSDLVKSCIVYYMAIKTQKQVPRGNATETETLERRWRRAKDGHAARRLPRGCPPAGEFVVHFLENAETSGARLLALWGLFTHYESASMVVRVHPLLHRTSRSKAHRLSDTHRM